MTAGNTTPPHVILGCFSRGGSSLVWNLLASHPDLVSPGVETHQLFLGRPGDRSKMGRLGVHLRHAVRGGGLPRPRLASGHALPNSGLFSATNLSRREIPRSMHREVAETILVAPTRVAPRVDSALVDGDDGSPRGVVLKSINGIVFLTPSLREILGSTRSVVLLRDPLALCESRLRRGTFSDPSKFGLVFRTLVGEMRRQVHERPDTLVVCFEDLLENPIGFTRRLYGALGLDASRVTEVRLKSKTHVREDDEALRHRAGTHFTVPLEELTSVIAPSVDNVQVARLSPEDRGRFERTAGSGLEWYEELRSQARSR